MNRQRSDTAKINLSEEGEQIVIDEMKLLIWNY